MGHSFQCGRCVSRRHVLGGGVSAIAALTITTGSKRAASTTAMESRMRQGTATPVAEEGRLLARPEPPTETVAPGLHPLGLDPDRDALLYVPAGYRPEHPAPFVLSLHGAGGDEEGGLYPLRDLADEAGLILLAPASRRQTWDVILAGYGPDIAFVDRALAAAFTRCAVEPAQLAVAGFSDGASYALSIGITNGDLFHHVMAFSPGFAAPAGQRGRPRFFVSHGTRDDVLPIDRTSRRIVPQLERAGYDVHYREFDGPHTVPPEIAREALDWYMAEPGSPTPTASPAATPTP